MATWLKFYQPTESSLNTVLSRNCTLEEVLDDGDLLQEYRCENQKLFELFV